jgi:hypothetical protein
MKGKIFVSPNGGDGWRVHRPGAARDIKHTATQTEAIGVAREVAINNSLELLIQGQNGQIRQKNSYGNDPFPPKG